jgi:WD40 repeat protein
MRLWDKDTGRELARFSGHEDRITAGGVSLDGLWAVSGGRDGIVKLWNLRQRTEQRSVQLNSEVRGCWFLLDGETVAAVTADGWLVLWSLPELEVLTELQTDIKVMCGDLAPSGTQIALGSEDGRIHIVAIDGAEQAPVLVTATPTVKPKAGGIARFLGKAKTERTYQYVCPACRHIGEVDSLPNQSIPCAACGRPLRLNREVPELSRA